MEAKAIGILKFCAWLNLAVGLALGVSVLDVGKSKNSGRNPQCRFCRRRTNRMGLLSRDVFNRREPD